MSCKQADIISGFIILIVAAGILFSLLSPTSCTWFKPIRTPTPFPTATPTPTPVPTATPTPVQTDLGTQGQQFTLNGTPTFLIGVSYYGALSAGNDIEQIKADIDFFVSHGFNWARVWIGWIGWDGTNRHGSAWWKDTPVPENVEKLRQMVAYADSKSFILDLTTHMCRNGYDGCQDQPWETVGQLKGCWQYLTNELRQYRNWYIDIANEHTVQDARYMSVHEVLEVRNAIKAIDPGRFVTASVPEDVGNCWEYVATEQQDFLTPHLSRGQDPWQYTCSFLALALPRVHGKPILLQEPFRNGYGYDQYEWSVFCRDLHDAIYCGAAGWCFHTDAGFDLHMMTFRNSLDRHEIEFMERMLGECRP